MGPSIFSFSLLRDSEQAGWIRPGLSPLRIMTGRPGKIKLLLNCANGKGFGVALVLMFVALVGYLFLPIFGNETKCCFEPFCLAEFGMASSLARLRKKTFLVGSVVHLIMMVTSFGIVPFSLR